MIKLILPTVAVVFLGACGAQPIASDDGSAAYGQAATRALPAVADTTAVDAIAEIVVPAPLTPDDSRSPIQRVLGVPPDLNDAIEWEHDLLELATSECLADAGFAYTTSSFNDTVKDGFIDPNERYFLSLTEKDREAYALARWGADPLQPAAESCEVLSMQRIFPLNGDGMLAKYDDDVEAAYAEEPLRSLAASRDSCVAIKGFESPSLAPSDVINDCSISSGLSDAVDAVREPIELRFIEQNTEYFVQFLDQFKQIGQY